MSPKDDSANPPPPAVSTSSPSTPVLDAERFDLQQDNTQHSTSLDPEKAGGSTMEDKVSVFKGLGWLDRFLAVWILLAMVIGVLLGNFVSNVGPALDKGKFVGVSVPIGMSPLS